MQNPLSKLALDAWYKALAALGGAGLFLTGAGIFTAFPTGPTAAISAGTLLIGIGEWINHSTLIERAPMPLPDGVITRTVRFTRPIGAVCVLGGVALAVHGLAAIFWPVP